MTVPLQSNNQKSKHPAQGSMTLRIEFMSQFDWAALDDDDPKKDPFSQDQARLRLFPGMAKTLDVYEGAYQAYYASLCVDDLGARRLAPMLSSHFAPLRKVLGCCFFWGYASVVLWLPKPDSAKPRTLRWQFLSTQVMLS